MAITMEDIIESNRVKAEAWKAGSMELYQCRQ